MPFLFPCIQVGTPQLTGHLWLCADAHELPQFHLLHTLDFIFPRVAASTTKNRQPPNNEMRKLGLGIRGEGVLFLPTRSWRDELRQAGKKTQKQTLEPSSRSAGRELLRLEAQSVGKSNGIGAYREPRGHGCS